MLWPAIPDADGALLLALLAQLGESERLAPDVLERRQMEALRRLLVHAAGSVSYYRERPAYADIARNGVLTAELWQRLPILGRAAVQAAGTALRSEAMPSEHGPVNSVATAGSTGSPVKVLGTSVTELFWKVVTLRDMVWHQRDTHLTLAAIRADPAEQIPAEGLVLPNWAPFLESVSPSGQCVLLAITHDVPAQALWLVDHRPAYVLSLPSNLLALAEHFLATGAGLPGLRQVWTYGEVVPPELRPACARAWGVELVDMYSCQEAGYLALQCAEAHSYHVQSEVVHLEILDGTGQPCRPGEVGRVVVTALHNYATPLLRYELGDYAEMGGRCACGRSLPVINRIVGRERNMWIGPDGLRMWPVFPSAAWQHISAIRRLQLVQHTVGSIEARVVGPRMLSGGEEEDLATQLRRYFPWDFELTFTYLRGIDRTTAVKFEEFVSLVER